MNMKIRSMHLENYRCFKDFDIDFDDFLTVIVGVNGAGKTATLDALSVFLKWAVYLTKGHRPKSKMSITDVSIGCKPEDIVHSITVQQKSGSGGEFVQTRGVLEGADDGVLMFNMADVLPIAQMLESAKPVCASYMAGRFVLENDFALTQNAYCPPDNRAIENSFARTIDYVSTISWFNDTDADEARAMRDSGRKDELPELKAVREALSKALLGQYEKPRMHGNPPELIIYRKGTNQAYKVSQLSDGYRAMLALVMDLARRMAQSRRDGKDSRESLLSTPAVVLIDEVELHLHPSWQQTVLTSLMGIFPNTQFIVTTHSPQVLSSIPHKHIRILSDGKAYTLNEQTQGVEASKLLKRVFGVESRPQGLDIVQELKEYSRLVYDEKWDAPEAVRLRKKLDEHYGNDENELMGLDLHIENCKWESGL